MKSLLALMRKEYMENTEIYRPEQERNEEIKNEIR